MDDVGITKNDLSAFHGPNYQNAEDYFSARSEFVLKEIEAMIYGYFSDKYKATSLVDEHRLGVFDSNLTTVLGTTYAGVQMEFNPSDVYFKFEISETSLWLNAVGDIDLEIWDLRQNKLLATKTITIGTSGQIVTDWLNKFFYSNRQPMNLFIGYDATGITSVKTPIRKGACTGCRGRYSCENTYMTARGVSVTGPMLDANVTPENHTSGLSIVYSISCDHQAWVCAYASTLALPIAYRIGETVLSDAVLNSGGERATDSHTVNADDTAKRYEWYQKKFRESFSGALENMVLPSNKCFHCSSRARTKAFAI